MNKSKYNTFIWSGLIFVVCFGLMFLTVSRETTFIQTNDIKVPSFTGQSAAIPGTAGLDNISEAVNFNSAGVPIIYFFLVAIVLGVILYFIPISKLWIFLRILFGFAFSWGTFVFFGFFVNAIIAGVIAAAMGITWFITSRIWLHNSLLVVTLVSLGAVFGALFSPWTVILVIAVIAIYDFLSVRFGYMQWMSRKLSESETLPAFFIPGKLSDWRIAIKGKMVKDLFEDKGDKQFSILGGGDIFFPLWLAGAVWFASGAQATFLVAGFSLLGLLIAYAIHFFIQKGKATPALPPIFLASLCGLLLARFIF